MHDLSIFAFIFMPAGVAHFCTGKPQTHTHTQTHMRAHSHRTYRQAILPFFTHTYNRQQYGIVERRGLQAMMAMPEASLFYTKSSTEPPDTDTSLASSTVFGNTSKFFSHSSPLPPSSKNSLPPSLSDIAAKINKKVSQKKFHGERKVYAKSGDASDGGLSTGDATIATYSV